MSTSPSDGTELVPILLTGIIVTVAVSGNDTILLTYSTGRQVMITSPDGSLLVIENGLASN